MNDGGCLDQSTREGPWILWWWYTKEYVCSLETRLSAWACLSALRVEEVLSHHGIFWTNLSESVCRFLSIIDPTHRSWKEIKFLETESTSNRSSIPLGPRWATFLLSYVYSQAPTWRNFHITATWPQWLWICIDCRPPYNLLQNTMSWSHTQVFLLTRNSVAGNSQWTWFAGRSSADSDVPLQICSRMQLQ
jgi:hypothetical protein